MDTCTCDFLRRARGGESVYITDVRAGYDGLAATESFPAPLLLTLVDGTERRYDLRLPRFHRYDDDGRRFAVDFFLAEVYNLLSSLGGSALRLGNPEVRPEAEVLAAAFKAEFGVNLPRHERRRYGKCLNVIERMLQALGHGGHGKPARFDFRLVASVPDEAGPTRAGGGGAIRVFQSAAKNLAGRTILGMDIGGTDIKLVLAVDGKPVRFMEYDWFPASFIDINQLIDPILSLVAGMAEQAPDRGGAAPFDAIGLCFPDVVVGNSIVGGEVFKTRGIRDALGADYDASFKELTNLVDKLRPFVAHAGAVGIINDGPMAAFTAGVEAAAANPDSVADGVFAYTLGTELGTGYVTGDGTIPDIPLEVYNFIIDLGSWPERGYEPDDLRSINNFNTSLPGTLQKFACQSGVFRLALKLLPATRPDLIQEMERRSFIVRRQRGNDTGLYVPTAPRDLRKPFLEFMMGLVDTDGDPMLQRIFKEIGVSLAVTGEEIDWIVRPTTASRMLFGRLVKSPACFDLMRQGALSRNPGVRLTVADQTMAETPLMRELAQDRQYTVAQFAQAVGAVHYGNYLLGTGGR